MPSASVMSVFGCGAQCLRKKSSFAFSSPISASARGSVHLSCERCELLERDSNVLAPAARQHTREVSGATDLSAATLTSLSV